MQTKTKIVLAAVIALAISIWTTAKAQAQSAAKGSDFPSCTETLSSVAVPDGPHGLFAIIFPNVKLQEKAEHFLLHNPVVCGFNTYLVWNEIDRGPEQIRATTSPRST